MRVDRSASSAAPNEMRGTIAGYKTKLFLKHISSFGSFLRSADSFPRPIYFADDCFTADVDIPVESNHFFVPFQRHWC